MTIIYYSPHPNIHLHTPAGPGVHIREVIRALEAEGHTVIPLIMGGTTPIDSSTPSHAKGGLKNSLKGIIPKVLWQTAKDLMLFRFDRHARRVLAEAIEKHEPDLIYERAYYGMVSGVEAAQAHGVRHILEMNAPYPEERIDMEGVSLFSSKARRAERQQLKLSSKVVVVSSALREYVIGKLPAAADKTIITPNAVRHDHTMPSNDQIEALRARLGISTDDQVIGFVGSIFPYHGVDRLIEAFAQAKQRFPRSKLLIVGGGSLLESLKDQAKQLDIVTDTIFTGNVTHGEVYTHIGVMDVSVMATSNWYGSPVKIFEYGIMGKPIIAPDVIPVTDVMENGIHGILIPPHVKHLHQALEVMLGHQELRDQMADAFRKKVKEHYTWRNIVRRILSAEDNNR